MHLSALWRPTQAREQVDLQASTWDGEGTACWKCPFSFFLYESHFSLRASPVNNKSSTFLYRLLLKARFGQDRTGANKSQLGKKLAASLASAGYEIPVSIMGLAWMSRQDRRSWPEWLTPLLFPTGPPGAPALRFQLPSSALSGYKLHFLGKFWGGKRVFRSVSNKNLCALFWGGWLLFVFNSTAEMD